MTATTATLILAILTGVLAVAAFVAIGVNMWLQHQERRRLEEAVFRAAIIEQVDECRAWVSAPPGLQDHADIGLIERLPHFKAVEALMAFVPLELSCFSRLLDRIARAKGWTYEKWAGSAGSQDWSSEWHWQVTQRQEVAGLLLGAATVCGHHDLVTALRGHSALQPIPWKPSRTETEAGQVTQGGVPPYPDWAAYQPWSPSAQDAWADRVGAAMQEHITAAMGPGLEL